MRTEMKRMSKGDILCRQHETANKMFVLRDGAVGVYVNQTDEPPPPDDITGKGKKIAELNESGTVIGEAGLFLARRTASLVIERDGTRVEYVDLDKDGAQRLIMRNPQMGLTLCRSLALHLRSLDNHIRQVGDNASEACRIYDRLSLDLYRLGLQIKREEGWQLQEVYRVLRGSEPFKYGKKLHDRQRRTETLFGINPGAHAPGEMGFRAGEIICREGELGRQVYLVRAGELEVRIGSTEIGRVGAGEMAGEIAVLLKESPHRVARLVAATDVTLLVVPVTEFNKLILDKPELLIVIAQSIAKRLENTNLLVCNGNSTMDELLCKLAGKRNSVASLADKLSTMLFACEEAERYRQTVDRIAEDARHLREDCQRRHRHLMAEG